MTGGIDFRNVEVPPGRAGGPSPATGSGAATPPQKHAGVDTPATVSFRELLSEKLGRTTGETAPVRFSGHASQRMLAAGVMLGRPEMERLGSAIDRVGERGGRDALVLLGSLAMVVNVPSRTVLTVVTPDRRGEGVFTNIDSAVIA